MNNCSTPLADGDRATPMPPLAVSLRQAAVLLGCCKKTVERLRDKGEIRCLRLGRHWKVRHSELLRYLKSQESKG
jgi:excisionase family DNA binding protein